MTHIWFIYSLSLPVFGLSQITLVVGSVAAAPVSAHHRSGGNNNRRPNWGDRTGIKDKELNCQGDDDDYCDFIWCPVPGNKVAGVRLWSVSVTGTV